MKKVKGNHRRSRFGAAFVFSRDGRPGTWNGPAVSRVVLEMVRFTVMFRSMGVGSVVGELAQVKKVE